MTETNPISPREIVRGYDNQIIHRRFLSYLFDTGGVAVACGVASLGVAKGSHLPWVVAGVVAVGYFVFFEGILGCTLGRYVSCTRIVDRNGNTPGLIRAAIRTFFRLFEANPIFLGGAIAGLVAAYTPYRQRIGDIVASTYVVRVSDLYLIRPGDYQRPSSRDWITKLEDWQKRQEELQLPLERRSQNEPD